MTDNPFLSQTIKRDARDLAKQRSRSALDESRSAESSNAFSEKSQRSFSNNERGSEDLIDMMEKGAFD